MNCMFWINEMLGKLMLTRQAQWPVLERVGLVCYSDPMSSSFMLISVYYWTSDFFIRG